ncbi:MAG: hypothetical protein DWB59_01190 [Anaerolineae bacterium]|nr:hypothetical protein [Anaerolineae bacterium]
MHGFLKSISLNRKVREDRQETQMEFTLHTTFETLTSISREWDELLSESVTDAPFLRFDYLRDWWQTLGGGEWPQAELTVVAAREAGTATASPR